MKLALIVLLVITLIYLTQKRQPIIQQSDATSHTHATSLETPNTIRSEDIAYCNIETEKIPEEIVNADSNEHETDDRLEKISTEDSYENRVKFNALIKELSDDIAYSNKIVSNNSTTTEYADKVSLLHTRSTKLFDSFIQGKVDLNDFEETSQVIIDELIIMTKLKISLAPGVIAEHYQMASKIINIKYLDLALGWSIVANKMGYHFTSNKCLNLSRACNHKDIASAKITARKLIEEYEL